METIAVTIHVASEIHAVLSEIQQNNKQGTKKKVALSEILLDFAKIGMQKEQKTYSIQEKERKIHSTQEKIANNTEKRHSTQNTQNLISK